MNRYVAQGLAQDAMSGKRIAVCAALRSEAVALFHTIASNVGETAAKVYRANGRELIEFLNGGRLTFHHAGAGLRGIQADITFVHGWNDLPEQSRHDAILTVSHGGELIRA